MKNLWCYKILPLVYDASLSYYEVLCKVVTYINNINDDLRLTNEEIKTLQEEVKTIQAWINNFNTSYAEDIIKQYISTMIFVEITDSGYIVYNIPQKWEDITFNTTGLDISTNLQPNYGYLVLSY